MSDGYIEKIPWLEEKKNLVTKCVHCKQIAGLHGASTTR